MTTRCNQAQCQEPCHDDEGDGVMYCNKCGAWRPPAVWLAHEEVEKATPTKVSRHLIAAVWNSAKQSQESKKMMDRAALVGRLRECAMQCDQPTSDIYNVAADQVERDGDVIADLEAQIRFLDRNPLE